MVVFRVVVFRTREGLGCFRGDGGHFEGGSEWKC